MMNYFSKLNYKFKFDGDIDTKTLFVIDTNYLLYAFQSYSFGKNYAEALENQKENIYIPFISFIEFFLNLDKTIDNVIGDFKKINIYMEQISINEELIDINNLKNLVIEKTFRQFSNYDKLNRLVRDEVQKELDEYANDVFGAILSKIEEINKIVNEKKGAFSYKIKNIPQISEYELAVEELKKRFDILFSEKQILGEAYTQDQINIFLNDMEDRYGNRIPPGFKDNSKNGIRHFGELSFPEKAGDLLLWKDTINFIQNIDSSKYENVVIITNDSKSDWRIDGKKSKSIHKLLKVEFLQKTGKAVDLLDVDKFVSYFSEVSSDESERIGEEIRSFEDKIKSNNTLRFSFEKNKYTVNNQNEMMYKLFELIVGNYSIPSSSLKRLACISELDFSKASNKYSELKNSTFRKFYTIEALDTNRYSLGTSLNIQDKFRYIWKLFKLVELEYSELIFENDNLQKLWCKTTGNLFDLHVDEVQIYLEEYEGMLGIPRISSVEFYNEGRVVENIEVIKITQSLINTELSHVDTEDCDYEKEIDDILNNVYSIDTANINIEIDWI